MSNTTTKTVKTCAELVLEVDEQLATLRRTVKGMVAEEDAGSLEEAVRTIRSFNNMSEVGYWVDGALKRR